MPEITQKLGFDTRSATRKLTNMTNKVNEFNAALVQLKANGGQDLLPGLTGSIDKNAKKVQSFTISWQTMARVIQTQIIVRSLGAISQGLQDGIDNAKELGLAIEEVQTIFGRTLPSSDIQRQLLNLSDAMGQSAQELAEGLYQTLSNQVVDASDAMTLLTESSKLATITASEMKDAINALSSVMNSYGLEAEQASYISDTLFKTVELGRLRLSEIANVIGRVTPLTAAMGVAWEEAAASIAVMTRQGVRADTAITQLRAIMTKIIRPTEEMREIFRKWGVEDGKQAIETFGGLRGVLIKLNEETGGSSEAMADLLRNVRTIVGQLSLMNDGGESLIETMNEIKNATGEVSSQWEEFSQSEAFRFERSVEALNNQMTRLGTTVMPAVTASFQALNTFLENQYLGWKTLLNLWDDADVQQEILARAAQKFVKEQDAINKWFAENQRNRYENLTETQAKYYAAARKEEFALEEIRDRALSRANQAIQDQGDSIVKYYKEAAKELKDFIDKANDEIKSNTEKIADINQQIRERQLDQELAKWQSNYAKIGVLERELNAQRQRAAQAFGDIDASKESKERALAENQIAIDLAEQAKKLAEAEGHTYTINKWEDAIQGLLQNRRQIYEETNKQIEASKDEAAELYKTMEEGEKRLEELIKERADLYKSGKLSSDDPKARADAERQLANIEGEINKIITDTARGDAFFQSLGLDTNLPKLTSGLTQALNDAKKDWQAEVERAKAAFEAAQFNIRVALDPSGTVGKTAEALGVERVQGESEVGFQRKVTEQAIDLLKEYESGQNSIELKQGEINNQLGVATGYLERVRALSEQRFNSLKALAEVYGNVRYALQGQEEKQKSLNELVRRQTEQQIGGALRFQEALRTTLEQTRQGVAADKEKVESLRQQNQTLLEQGQINDEQFSKQNSIIDAIEDARGNAEALNRQMEALPEEAKAQAAQELVDKIREGKDSTIDMEGAAELFRQRLEAADQLLNGVPGSIDQAKQSFDNATQSAGGTRDATAQIGPTAAAQVGGVNALAQAYAELATQARAAAQAQAASGGAVAYHGGPMARYFASGGRLSRGQDKILTALSAGETVVNAKNSRRFFSELNSMNQGSEPAYREQGGPVTNVGDVNVTVNGGDSSQQTVREIAHALRREIQRGNIKLR